MQCHLLQTGGLDDHGRMAASSLFESTSPTACLVNGQAASFVWPRLGLAATAAAPVSVCRCQADQECAPAVIDNLVKGASGQALQNLNLLMGQPESTGLLQQALFP